MKHCDEIKRTSAAPEAAAPSRPPGALDYGDYDESGVDLSLLRYVLAMSPLERLVRMEERARDTLILYEYGRQHREAKTGANR